MIGLLLGTGDLPCQLINTLTQKNKPFICILFEGFENAKVLTLAPNAHIVKIGHVGKILDILKKHDISTISCAGHVKRPSFRNIDLDEKGRSWLARLGLSLFKGDDGLLQALTKLMKDEGLTLISTKDLLDDLTFNKGVWTKCQPTEIDQRDIDQGIQILKHLSPLDIGQALVIEDGIVLGIEAIEGTKVLIKRIHSLRQVQTQPSGILIKMPKIGQSTELDLPTIGPETIDDLHASGLKGLAIEGQYTQVINKDLVLQKADEYGLFIQVF